jgi:hypothetical protein
MSENPDPFDDVVLDDSFIAGGVKEPTAAERTERAARIARGNDRLSAAGEIAVGSGKPSYQRLRKSTPWILIGVVVAVAIVAVAFLVR